ncbi:MAG: hypothetical protein ACK5KU_07925 [Beutenbergiaceae bacterium]
MNDQHNEAEASDIPVPAPVEDPWRNIVLLVALVVAGLEALTLFGAAIWSVVSMSVDDAGQTGLAVGLAVVLVVFGLLLIAGINALWHGRRWGRGPVLTWQLLQVALVLGAVGLAPAWAIGAILVMSLLVGVGLLHPASVAATGRTTGSGAVL